MSKQHVRIDEHLAMERRDASQRAEGATDRQNTFENSQSRLDWRLDQALEQTFPASDPVSVCISL